jgi:hypothetical protein
MFERFTDRARRVLVLAQDEARRLNHNFIGTEHILLGLVREGDGVAAKTLGSLGIRLEAVREKVEETIGPAGTSTTGSPPFTPRAKKVLELSLREALQLGHNYIGTEHILLGLVREAEGVAAQVLVSLGADLANVRQQVLDLLDGNPAHSTAHEARAAPSGPVRPRCGRCGASVSESARYGRIEARPGGEDAGEGQGPLSVTVIYCGHCGTVLGPPLEAGAAFGELAARTAQLGGSGQGRVGGRPHRLPSEPLGPVSLEDVPEGARVELVYRDNELIEGAVAGTEVRLRGPVRSRRGPVKGTWGEVEFGAAWRIGDKRYVPTNPSPAIMSGRFGEEAVKLKGDFQLGPHQSFERAELSGDLGGQSLRAEVSAADGGLGTTSAVVAEGTVGETPFEFFVAFSDDLKRALVRGSVGGRPVSLDATRDDPAGQVRIIGAYFGEPPLLVLVVGAVIHFL